MFERIAEARTPAMQAVLDCDNPDDAYDLAAEVPAEEITIADVLACRHQHAAGLLAIRMPHPRPTVADVFACRFEDVARILAPHVPYGSPTLEDVLACKWPAVACILGSRAKGNELLLRCERRGYLYALGEGDRRIYFMDYVGPWTAEEAIRRFEDEIAAPRFDIEARYILQAIRKDLRRIAREQASMSATADEHDDSITLARFASFAQALLKENPRSALGMSLDGYARAWQHDVTRWRALVQELVDAATPFLEITETASASIGQVWQSDIWKLRAVVAKAKEELGEGV